MSEEKIIQKLLEHDERFDSLVTKNEFHEFKDQILTGLDQAMTILKRLDQERIFTIEWVKRIEKEVKEHSSEIKHIKQVLKIA